MTTQSVLKVCGGRLGKTGERPGTYLLSQSQWRGRVNTRVAEVGYCPITVLLVAAHQHVPLPSRHSSPTHLLDTVSKSLSDWVVHIELLLCKCCFCVNAILNTKKAFNFMGLMCGLFFFSPAKLLPDSGVGASPELTQV